MDEIIANLQLVAASLQRMDEPLRPLPPEPVAPPAWLAYEPDANGVTHI